MGTVTTPRSRSLRLRFLVALGVVAVVVGAYALWNRDTSSSTDSSSNASKSPGQQEAFTTFRDEQSGFSVQHPRSWRAVTAVSDDPQVKLVVGPLGGRDYLRVRVVPLASEVNIDARTPQEELNALQGQLDKFIDEAPGVTEVHERSRVNLNDLPGWFYLYTFKDETTGEEGLHSHFFLFDGAQMNILVFQALPKSDFRELSATFDRILGSFRSLRRPATSPATTGSPAPAVSPPPP
jgi:hypothetical protein